MNESGSDIKITPSEKGEDGMGFYGKSFPNTKEIKIRESGMTSQTAYLPGVNYE